MLIPDEIRKCVVYIGYRLPSEDMAFSGTGFFLTHRFNGTDFISQYLVTAKHIIHGIESKENFDGFIWLRINLLDGNSTIIETKIDDWKFHDDTEIDVAVLPNPEVTRDLHDIKMIPTSMSIDPIKERNNFGIGNEVFLTGLFYNHSGRARNIPIVRDGQYCRNAGRKSQNKVRSYRSLLNRSQVFWGN